MRFSTWEPVYEAILEDFGYERAADERARDVLATLTEPFDRDRLSPLTEATVAVAGGAPTLSEELGHVRSADAVIAASGAAAVLREAGIVPTAMVTDLDKTPKTAVDLSAHDGTVVVHAHGDNVQAVRKWLPEFATETVLPTTQAAPTGPVENFGGFTDGDRAAFLADAVGAGTLTFPGWDFDDPTVGPEKRRKLVWAERLLHWLEHRRQEHFDLLDGRRQSIDTTPLPV